MNSEKIKTDIQKRGYNSLYAWVFKKNTVDKKKLCTTDLERNQRGEKCLCLLYFYHSVTKDSSAVRKQASSRYFLLYNK